MAGRNLDLLTGIALLKPKPAKSGSRGLKHRRMTPRAIPAKCYYCKTGFDEEHLYTALPLLSGWVHYQCHVEQHAINVAMAKRDAKLKQLRT